jgi:hypothetical protein
MSYNQNLSKLESSSTIPSNKIKCIITGKLRKNTEEKIRQIAARSLIEEYSYYKKDIGIEFSIKMGRAKKRAVTRERARATLKW